MAKWSVRKAIAAKGYRGAQHCDWPLTGKTMILDKDLPPTPGAVATGDLSLLTHLFDLPELFQSVDYESDLPSALGKTNIPGLRSVAHDITGKYNAHLTFAKAKGWTQYDWSPAKEMQEESFAFSVADRVRTLLPEGAKWLWLNLIVAYSPNLLPPGRKEKTILAVQTLRAFYRTYGLGVGRIDWYLLNDLILDDSIAGMGPQGTGKDHGCEDYQNAAAKCGVKNCDKAVCFFLTAKAQSRGITWPGTGAVALDKDWYYCRLDADPAKCGVIASELFKQEDLPNLNTGHSGGPDQWFGHSMGRNLAHELCHFLGCADRPGANNPEGKPDETSAGLAGEFNLMHSGTADDSSALLYMKQMETMKKHPQAWHPQAKKKK